ncbi:MAG: hypothetical protein U1E62_23500 [Alsobacter sp.]
MADQPSVPFGKRRPAKARPPRKRSESARLKLMAGAGAAALGVYAVAPGASCPEGRFYRSLSECVSDNKVGEALCRAGFTADAGAGAPAGIVFSGPGWGTATSLVSAPGGGLMTQMGEEVDEGAYCRAGQRSASSSRSSSGGGSSSSRRSAWWGGGDGGSSSSSSNSGYHAVSDGGGHSVSRGGFGSSGHGFGGGGGG